MKINQVKKWVFKTYTKSKKTAINLANEIITEDLKNPNLKIRKVKEIKPIGFEITVY